MDGFFIDDPMLALIARFAGCCSDTKVSEEVFLREQVLQVRAYIESFPPDQNQERALEWISRNAEGYRRKWQRELMEGEALASRCHDCPLERQCDMMPCEIHDLWLTLLKGYAAGKVSSQEYVEETLTLLRRHKERLRKSLSRVALV